MRQTEQEKWKRRTCKSDTYYFDNGRKNPLKTNPYDLKSQR